MYSDRTDRSPLTATKCRYYTFRCCLRLTSGTPVFSPFPAASFLRVSFHAAFSLKKKLCGLIPCFILYGVQHEEGVHVELCCRRSRAHADVGDFLPGAGPAGRRLYFLVIHGPGGYTSCNLSYAFACRMSRVASVVVRLKGGRAVCVHQGCPRRLALRASSTQTHARQGI